MDQDLQATDPAASVASSAVLGVVMALTAALAVPVEANANLVSGPPVSLATDVATARATSDGLITFDISLRGNALCATNLAAYATFTGEHRLRSDTDKAYGRAQAGLTAEYALRSQLTAPAGVAAHLTVAPPGPQAALAASLQALATAQAVLRSPESLEGLLLGRATVTGALTLDRPQHLQAITASQTTATATLTRDAVLSVAAAWADVTARGDIRTYTADLRATVSAGARTTAALSFPGDGLTVADAIDDMLVLMGIQRTAVSAQWMRTRALHDLNAAAQMVWTACVDLGFIGKTTLEVAFEAAQDFAPLPANVQTVLGNVRVGQQGAPLLKLATRSQWQNFAAVFGVSSGPVLAWYADSYGRAESDSIAVRLHLAPPMPEAGTVFLDVIEECPRYNWPDYAARTALRIPHQYAESCLLPICRYLAAGSGLFNKPELKAQIDVDYQRALGLLRLSDPKQEDQERSNAKAPEVAARA